MTQRGNRQMRLSVGSAMPSLTTSRPRRQPASPSRNSMADSPQDICGRHWPAVRPVQFQTPNSSISTNGHVWASSRMIRAWKIMAIVSWRAESGSICCSDQVSSRDRSSSSHPSKPSTSRSPARASSASRISRSSSSMASNRSSSHFVSGFLTPGSYSAAGRGMPLRVRLIRRGCTAASSVFNRASVSRRHASFWSSMRQTMAGGGASVTPNVCSPFGVAQ